VARHAGAVAAAHAAAANVAAAAAVVGAGEPPPGPSSSAAAAAPADARLPAGTDAAAAVRVRLGRIVRGGGATWRLALVAAALRGPTWGVARGGPPPGGGGAVAAAAADGVAVMVAADAAAAARVAAAVAAARLADAWAWPPALTGRRVDAALPRRLTGWVAARAGATGLAPDKVVRVALEWARREGGDAVFSVPPVVDGADDGAPVDGVFLVDEAHVRWLDAVVSLGVVGSKGEGLQRVLAAAAAADADVVFGVIRCRTGGCDEAAEAVDKVAAAKTA